MKCTRVDCFAHDVTERNGCSALVSIRNCAFYKSKAELEAQRKILIGKGKPYYEAAKTAAENRILLKLLKGEDDERAGDLDKDQQKHT